MRNSRYLGYPRPPKIQDPFERGRSGERKVLAPPDELDPVHDDEHDSYGEDQFGEMSHGMDIPEQISFHHEPHESRGDRREEQRQPEASGPGHELIAEVGGQHEKCGMGDVQDPHHAKDQGQAGRHQKEHHSVGESVYALSHIHRGCRIHIYFPLS